MGSKSYYCCQARVVFHVARTPFTSATPVATRPFIYNHSCNLFRLPEIGSMSRRSISRPDASAAADRSTDHGTTDLHMHVPWRAIISPTAPRPGWSCRCTAALIARARKARRTTCCSTMAISARQSDGRLSGAAEDVLPAARTPPSAMNALDYDAATIGNHDFSFGMGLLRRTLLRGRAFPLSPVTFIRETSLAQLP